MSGTSTSTDAIKPKRLVSARTTSADILTEARLLGTPRLDTDGVEIRRPRTAQEQKMVLATVASGNHRRETDGKKLHHGGPRPTNTLNRAENIQYPSIRARRDGLHMNKATPLKPLQTQTVRGDNLKDRTGFTYARDSHVAPHSAKRRKLFDAEPTMTSSSSFPEVDKPVQQVRPRDLKIGNLNTAQSPPYRASRTSRSRDEVWNDRKSVVDEFQSVEKTMQSGMSEQSRRAKKRQRRQHSQGRSTQGSSMSSPVNDVESSHITIDDASDLDEVEMIEEQSYPRPEIKLRHGEARTYQLDHTATDEETVSKYFVNDGRAQSRPQEKQNSRLNPTILAPNAVEFDRPLGKTFVDADGRHRGAASRSISPDELAGETTVGKNGRRPAKSRDTTLAGSLLDAAGKTRPQDPQDLPLAKSKKTQRRNSKVEEAPAAWGVPIAAVMVPRKGASINSSSGGEIGLQHDEIQDIYNIIQAGHLLKQEGISGQIHPQRLNRVVYADHGTQVRFESAHTDGVDDKLDLVFATHKAIKSFLAHLERKSKHVVKKVVDSPQMEKMFRRQRLDLTGRPIFPAPNKQVGLTKAQWDQEMAQQDIATRLGPRKRLVGELLNGANQPSPKHASASGLENSSNIDAVVERLNPKHDFDAVPRRSTRSTVPRTAFKKTSPDVDEPEPEKYSKVHGLGKKWKKPFTYPEVGKKKATLDFSDLEKLDEGEFLNDALITFWMRYQEELLAQKKPEVASRIHFFNTFFFQRLTENSKGKREINYAGVQKWTKNVDIFAYDYLVVPINENAHWYLAIICNLPSLPRNPPVTGVTPPPGEAEQCKSPRSESRVSEESTATLDGGPVEEPPTEENTRESFADMNLEGRVNIAQGEPDMAVLEREGHKESKTADTDQPKLGDLHSVEEPPRKTDAKVEDDMNSTANRMKNIKAKKKKAAPPITNTDPNTPMILTFDSLGHTRPMAARALRDYLFMEAKTKRGGWEIDRSLIKTITSHQIPQQLNFSDCGLYMLGYLEKFLTDEPKEFVRHIVKRSFSTEDWAMIAFDSLRTIMRSTIFELYHKVYGNDLPTPEKGKNAIASHPATPALESPAPQQPADAEAAEVPLIETERPPSNREKALESAHTLDEEALDESNLAAEEPVTQEKIPESSIRSIAESDITSRQWSNPQPEEAGDPGSDDTIIPDLIGEEGVTHRLSTPAYDGDVPVEDLHAYEPNLPTEIADSQEVRERLEHSAIDSDLRVRSPEFEPTVERRVITRRERTPPNRTDLPVIETRSGLKSPMVFPKDDEQPRSSPRQKPALGHQRSPQLSPKRPRATTHSAEVDDTSKRRRRNENGLHGIKARSDWTRTRLPVSETFSRKHRQQGNRECGEAEVRAPRGTHVIDLESDVQD